MAMAYDNAACRNNGILITICAATSLAALSYEGATTAHSLFSYPVEDETDVDDQNLHLHLFDTI
jgi:hypothetical protein